MVVAQTENPEHTNEFNFDFFSLLVNHLFKCMLILGELHSRFLTNTSSILVMMSKFAMDLGLTCGFLDWFGTDSCMSNSAN